MGNDDDQRATFSVHGSVILVVITTSSKTFLALGPITMGGLLWPGAFKLLSLVMQ